ncbi:MAG TPA: FAD-dependent oxidoreductase [Gemmatimonadaceae bacterium]|jgi:glycine/D-amino acid oxidase-like deaminating enzyme|nr:FAD-dependent oxidoreductase [Gemmatimonadaceae bacterium]
MTGAGRPDVVVVGAGIVGAACARELALAGLRVLICESAFPGAGTTSAGMGHIVVMDDSPAQLALTALSRRLWQELEPELPPSCEDSRPGTLWIAGGPDEMHMVREKAVAYAEAGVRTEVLDATALAAAEPNLRPGLSGALLVPDDRVLYPPGAARWLLEDACARGADLRVGVRVTAIEGGRVSVEAGSGAEVLTCGAVVLATGVDAAQLVPGLPVVPRKGHLVITERYPGLIRHQLVELGYLHSAHAMSGASTAFNLQPRPTGQVLIGSSRELVGRDGSVNRRIAADMVRRAVEFVPALARCVTTRTWTGFRPATPDSLPLIGAWRNFPGLYVAAGHEGLGITTATGTAALIRAMLAGGNPPVDPAPFDPMRAMPALEAA